MARVLIVSRSAAGVADATKQFLSILSGDHRIVVLLVERPYPVAPLVGEEEELLTGGLELSGATELDNVLASAAAAEADARSELDDALRPLHLDSKVQVRVESGDPGETFCRVAAEIRADLMVLGRRSRSLRSRLTLGSITRYVLEHSHCPVLMVHENND